MLELVRPLDGSASTRPVRIEVRVEGVAIRRAGRAIEGAGYVVISIRDGCLPPKHRAPIDEHHVHFGAGELESWIDLPLGRSSLCAQVADGLGYVMDLRDEAVVDVVD